MLIPIETNEKLYIDGFKYYKKVFDMVERMWKIESINKLFFKTYYFQSINKECTRVFNELMLFI